MVTPCDVCSSHFVCWLKPQWRRIQGSFLLVVRTEKDKLSRPHKKHPQPPKTIPDPRTSKNKQKPKNQPTTKQLTHGPPTSPTARIRSCRFAFSGRLADEFSPSHLPYSKSYEVQLSSFLESRMGFAGGVDVVAVFLGMLWCFTF